MIAIETTASPSARRMPRTPVESRPLKTRTSVAGKRMARPSRVVSITSSSSDAMQALISRVPSGSFIAILPLRMTLVKSSSALRRTSPSEVAKTICRLAHSSSGTSTGRIAATETPAGIGRMLTIALPRALRPASGSRQVFSDVDHALGGEDEERGVGVGDEEAGDEVLVLGRHALRALAAAALRAVLGQRRALDVAAGGDGDRHVLALDQVLVVEVGVPVDHLGAAGDGEELAAPRAARRR